MKPCPSPFDFSRKGATTLDVISGASGASGVTVSVLDGGPNGAPIGPSRTGDLHAGPTDTRFVWNGGVALSNPDAAPLYRLRLGKPLGDEKEENGRVVRLDQAKMRKPAKPAKPPRAARLSWEDAMAFMAEAAEQATRVHRMPDEDLDREWAAIMRMVSVPAIAKQYQSAPDQFARDVMGNALGRSANALADEYVSRGRLPPYEFGPERVVFESVPFPMPGPQDGRDC